MRRLNANVSVFSEGTHENLAFILKSVPTSLKFRLELSTLITSRSSFSNFGSSDLRRAVFHLSPSDAKLLVQLIIYCISHFTLNYDFLFCRGWYKNRVGWHGFCRIIFLKQHFAVLGARCNYSQTAFILAGTRYRLWLFTLVLPCIRRLCD